jgi:hypothetical protein
MVEKNIQKRGSQFKTQRKFNFNLFIFFSFNFVHFQSFCFREER